MMSVLELTLVREGFPNETIRHWNALSDSIISSAEDDEDCVGLVRARE